MRVYLDNCCFNRPFDDQENVRVAIETQAKLYIQEEIKSGHVQLVWSYILDFENNNNPHFENRSLISDWKRIASVDLEESEEVLAIANECMKIGLKQYDALHLACSVLSECNYFITTDRTIINRIDIFRGIKIINPVEYINMEVDS